jgi:hypothetical protein
VVFAVGGYIPPFQFSLNRGTAACGDAVAFNDGGAANRTLKGPRLNKGNGKPE